MDFLVQLPFRSNAKLGILRLGNKRVGVRFFMARVLMKILETKEMEGRKEGRKQLRKTGKTRIFANCVLHQILSG
jgi:hypothetical protein